MDKAAAAEAFQSGSGVWTRGVEWLKTCWCNREKQTEMVLKEIYNVLNITNFQLTLVIPSRKVKLIYIILVSVTGFIKGCTKNNHTSMILFSSLLSSVMRKVQNIGVYPP